MRVQQKNPTRPNGHSSVTVEQFAARFNLNPQKSGEKVEYHGANPIDPNGASEDGFILFQRGNAHDRKLGRDYKWSDLRPALTGLAEMPPSVAPNARPKAEPKNERFDWEKLTHLFTYQDEDGELLFQIGRMATATGKTARPRRPAATNADGEVTAWHYTMGDSRRVLYHLPEVILGPKVLICEGEKCVDFVRGLIEEANLERDYGVTCVPFGAKGWRDEFSPFLADKEVFILPDHDQPGRDGAAKIAGSVYGTAFSLRVIELPGQKEKNGADDWLARGHHIGELLELAESAPLWAPPYTAPPITTDGKFALDDIGNGRRFAAQHRHVLRFCTTREKWLVYSGGVWTLDKTKEVDRRAKTTAETFLAASLALLDMEQRSKSVPHAVKMQQNGKRSTMADDASSEDGMACSLDLFDQNPHVFNLKNGTLDLSTGTFREHNPDDYLSLQSPALYDRAASCPLWLKCLERWIPDAGTRDYIQDCVGLTLSGVSPDEFFNFLYGDGGNGKSKFIGTLEALLGTYWQKTEAQTLMAARDPRRAEAPSAAILALKGARLVTAHEIESKNKLDSGLVKDLTGRDAISARGLHEKHITTFIPQFTLWMFGNGKPTITDTSNGMWRRVRLINFNQQIPAHEKDGYLGERLKAELSGILNWALAGLYRVQRRGVVVPEAVVAATEAYRAEHDPLSQFIGECCEVGINFKVSNEELWNAWKSWSEANGESLRSPTFLTQELKRRNCETFTNGRIRGLTGIAVFKSLSEKPSEVLQVSSEKEVATLATLSTLSPTNFQSGELGKPKKRREKGNHADSEAYAALAQMGVDAE